MSTPTLAWPRRTRPKRKLTMLPEGCRFAVVQMDPVTMVEHLNDAIATAAAMQLRPKKYLVYVHFVSRV